MATSLYSPKLSGSKFKNWIKAGLGVLFTKEGIEPFVYDEIEQFQQKCLSDICINNGLPAGTICSSCCTENVIVCPTNRICNGGRGKCKYHRNSATQYLPSGCPNKICHNIKNEIQNAHRFHGPSFKNTDATQWCSNPWEVAKCFMPPDGYKDVTSAAETDFNGIISVIINYKAFQAHVKDDLSKKSNIFEQGREVGKAVRHCPQLEMEDTELKQHFTDLQNLLSDPAYLSANTAAQNAKTKLLQLQNDILVIGKDDIGNMLDDVAKAVQDKILTETDEDKKEAEKTKLELINITNKSVEAIDSQGKLSVAQLDKALKSAFDELEKQTKESLNKVQSEADIARKQIKESAEKGVSKLEVEAEAGVKQIEDSTDKGVKKLEVEAEAGVTKISAKADEALKRIEESTTANKEDKYNKLREDMKEDLIKFYRKYYSNIPVSSLVEEQDVPLTDFYVQSPLTSIDIQRKFRQCKQCPKRAPIHSYRDMFLRGDGELYKDIYITANAGVGKTSFAKQICMTWCQAHRPTETSEQTFKSEDINSMKTFEFLFMVPLRDVDTSICDLDSMIESNILHYLARYSRFSRLDLEDILNERTCLVLLDGLDEWTHPTSCVRGRRDVHAPPHIPARDRCTVLTTTRPWKLDVIKLGSNQIDRHVEINELDEASSKELTRKAITVLNRQSLPDQPKTAEEFERATSTLKLDNLRYIPYILLQMICLWFDGKSIGRTKCEIYTNIITLTLSRGLLKVENKGLPPMRGQNIEATYEIPPCLKSNDICKSHYEVFIGLALLAFKKLFSSKAESNLVFDRSEVLQVISEDILRFCLEIGFLSQNKDYGLVSGRRSILSFQHKSVQEYFAALYISSHNQEIKDDIYKVCNTLPAILEMSNVFIFLAGFSPAAVGKISQIIRETFSRDEKIEYFRNSIINSKSYVPKSVQCWEIMKSWQRMLTDSVQEISNSGQNNAYLYIEDLLIDSTISIETCGVLKLLTEDNAEKIKSISISECRTTEEFTDKFETLRLQDMLSLHKLIIQALPKATDLHRLLSGSVQTLTVLILEFIIFENRLLNREIMEIPSETVIILSSMTNMQMIYLRNIRLRHGDIERLYHYLMTRTTMTLINLAHMICIEHDGQCNAFCLDLSQHKELEDLGLDTVPLSELNVDVSSVKLCAIGRLQPDVQSSLVKCLPEAINLRIVSFHSFQPEQSEIIIDTLPKLPKLERITIQFSNLGDTALILPTSMINLEIVHLYNAVLTSTSLRRLIESVDVLPKQVLINMLSCTVIPGKDFRQVKEEIRSSPKYQVMFDGLNRGGEDMFQFQTWNE